MIKLVITENESNQRLDRFLKKYLKRAPLAMIYKIIRKDVKINGRRGKEDTILAAGDELTLYIPDDKLAEFTKTERRAKARRTFGIIYEDENLLVVNKPSGLLTHGDAHEKKNTLVNQVCGYLQEKGEFDPAGERTFAPAPANRLDRNTSGLVVFGKTAEALRELTAMIRQREAIDKYYRAIVCGNLRDEMVIDERLEKDEMTNKVSVVDSVEKGKAAYTVITPVRSGDRLSLVEIKLVTGRTHQIRVHLSHVGHPIAGDVKYGNRGVNGRLRNDFGVTSQLLHACRLEMGYTKGNLDYLNGRVFEAPVPEVFNKIMEEVN